MTPEELEARAARFMNEVEQRGMKVSWSEALLAAYNLLTSGQTMQTYVEMDGSGQVTGLIRSTTAHERLVPVTDDRQRAALVDRPEAFRVRDGKLEAKPRVRLGFSRLSFLADGEDRVRITVVGRPPEDLPDEVHLTINGEPVTFTGDPIELTATEPGIFLVRIVDSEVWAKLPQHTVRAMDPETTMIPAPFQEPPEPPARPTPPRGRP